MKRSAVRYIYVLLVLMFTGFFVSGCGGDGNTGHWDSAESLSIAVTPATSSVPVGAARQFVATATFADGTSRVVTEEASWASGTPGIATVNSASGLATGVSAGSALITATFDGKSGSATLTVTAVTLNSIAVTPATATIPSGLTQTFVATGAYSDGSSQNLSDRVIWSSNNTSIATVASPGVATGLSAGSALITATFDGKSGSATLTVSAVTLNSIAVTPATGTIPSGLTQAFVATGAYSDGTSQNLSDRVVWSSNNTSIATVASPGVATGVSAGSAMITATFDGKSGSTTLTVTAATLNTIAVTPATATIPSGLTQAFVATGAYSDGTSQNLSDRVIWSSDDVLIATVVSPGDATGLSAGSALITATFDGKSGSATLTVTDATLESIEVLPAQATIAVDGSQTFVATGAYSDGTSQNLSAIVIWSSDATLIATVVSPGVATGLSTGSALITATLADMSGSATLTVTDATLESIEVLPAQATIAVDGSQTFVAMGTYSDSITPIDISDSVIWSSDATLIATVVSPGVATGVSVGSALITATLADMSGSATLTVTDATLESIEVLPAQATIAVDGSQIFVAMGNYSDGSSQDLSASVDWSSDNTQVATVVSPGVATGLLTGTAMITATVADTLPLLEGSAELIVTAEPVQGPQPVILGLAANFAGLSKAGITDVPSSDIIGNIGASPISGAAIGVTCAEVTGTIYAVDAAGPAPCSVIDPVMLTTAVSNLETAYTDAAGRPAGVGPNLNLGAGTVAGQTLVPGTYTWGSNVTITTDLTLNGGPNDTWLFQITGTLDLSPNMQVLLSGGALAKNIFWQVSDSVTLGTGSHFEGNILAQTNIAMNTGASINGRLLAQTGVSLDQNTIIIPAP